MTKYGRFDKNDDLVEEIVLRKGKLRRIGGKQAAAFTPEYMKEHGFTPYIEAGIPLFLERSADITITKKDGLLVSYTHEAIAKSAEYVRDYIRQDIYGTHNFYANQITANYSFAECSRWSLDNIAIKTADWVRFDNRSGSLTGQQYAEQRVIPKIEAGDAFLDVLTSKRTDLMLALDNTADRDLLAFDYKSVWDDDTDFSPPPVEIVAAGFWAGLKSILNYKVW